LTRHVGLPELDDPSAATNAPPANFILVGRVGVIAVRSAGGKSGIWYHHGALVVTADFCREVVAFLLAYVKETQRRTYIPFKDEALERRMRAS
jgi:hypothetical protein